MIIDVRSLLDLLLLGNLRAWWVPPRGWNDMA